MFGFTHLVRHWRWLVIAHAGLVVAVAVYLAVVALNSLSHGYNFWSEPAPTRAAERTAVVSLWALFVLWSLIGVVVYGALCRHALEARHGPVAVGHVLLSSIGPSLRTSWFSLPAFVVTVAGVVLLLPGVLLIALFGGMPFPFVAGLSQPFRLHGTLLVRRSGELLGIAAVTALVAVPLWLFALTAGYLTGEHDGLVQALSWPLAWILFVLGAVVCGWASSAFSFVFERSAGTSA